jgi:hypothetical protein
MARRRSLKNISLLYTGTVQEKKHRKSDMVPVGTEPVFGVCGLFFFSGSVLLLLCIFFRCLGFILRNKFKLILGFSNIKISCGMN